MTIADCRPWSFALLLLILWAPSRAQVTIKNNAYSGIVIGIEDSIDEDPNLLEGIRNAFTEASQFLYDITEKRAYFSSISILVPPSWPDDPNYEIVGNERLENSDFRITRSLAETDAPFVERAKGCGEIDGVCRFAPGHFTNAQSFAQRFGPYGKEIVYHWAQIRFGVFDESPASRDEELYPVNGGDDYEGSRCSLQIPGQKKAFGPNGPQDCSLADAMADLCIFIPDENVQGKFASIMYSRKLNHVSKFCDESGGGTAEALVHNPIPTNAQNTQCQRRSVWEVIRDHPDYGEMDPPRQGPSTVPSTPTFKILRSRPSSIVLVLDTSGSMGGPRIQRLSQGVAYFLEHVVQNGIEVGMVGFNHTAFALQAVSEMSDAIEQQFIDAVPTTASGGTSIGGGIALALNLLKDANIHGGTLIVVSDGGENSEPLIMDIFEDILASDVRIHTVAISNAADTGLEALALSTGGNAYFSLDNDESNAITEAFLDIGEYLTTGNVNESEPIVLYSESSTLDPNAAKMGSVIIDATLGLNTEITFDYASSAGVEIELQPPMGQSYDITSNECKPNSNIQIITCRFPQNSETGVWQYTVTSKSSNSQRVSVIFRSQPRDPADPPVIARAFWAFTGNYTVVPGGPIQRLFATVSKGLRPVLDADVIAIVDSGSPSPTMLNLVDDGGGIDLHINDGIYSASFGSFNGDVRYAVKVSVNGQSATTTSLQTYLGKPTPPSSGNAAGRRKRAISQMTGQFQRVASGGSFQAMGTASLKSTPYPPGRITDLRVLSIDTTLYRVTLQWTAQGGSLDVGAAAEYEIRRGYEHSLTANYSVVIPGDVVQGNLSAPATAGTVEQFILQLPTGDGAIYYLGIIPKAINTTADISNVVSLTTRPITLASLGVVPTTQAPTTTQPPTTTEALNTSSTSPLTIGLVTLMIVVFVVIGVGVTCFPRRNGRFSKTRPGRGQRLAVPRESPYVHAHRPPTRSAWYQARGGFVHTAKRPLAYYPHPYSMNAAYQGQAFLSVQDIYGRAQSVFPKPRSVPMNAYSNAGYWYR